MFRVMRRWYLKRIALSAPLVCLCAVAMGQGGPAPVVVAKVEQRQVTAMQAFVGTVTPSQMASIGSAVSGRVIECDIDEGDRVADGQALAQLLTETIDLEIASAQGELEYRQALLAELENGTRREQVEQARARMAATGARREYLENRRERLRDLAERTTAVTEDEWSEAVSLAAEALEAHAEATAAYDEAQAGPRKEAIAQARAQVVMQQAVVDRLKDQLGKHTMRSRFEGYVVAKHTEIGQWVNTGDPIADVAGVDVVWVVVQVLEQSVPYLMLNEEVSVVIPALPQSPFTGKVVAIVPQGDVRARTFPVKIAIQNQSTESGPLIKPGMYARVELPVGSMKQAILVPKDAVVLDQRSPLIYVVEGASAVGEQGTVSPVPVKLGSSHGPLIDIGDSLKPGQIVVVEGNERLRPGAAISIARIAEAPAGP